MHDATQFPPGKYVCPKCDNKVETLIPCVTVECAKHHVLMVKSSSKKRTARRAKEAHA